MYTVAHHTCTQQVQTKDTLKDALDLYVAGETLSGDNKYVCESCNRRVTAQRRCAIKALPSTLILHLKRFEWNVETMSRRKLNHRCAFPT
jgi:ubiquitin carboxyl-terminal hydrolase 34